MTNVAHAKKTTAQTATGCPCGWGRHCRCLAGRRRFWDEVLVNDMRALLESGSDLAKRRRAHAVLREKVSRFDQHEQDTAALRALYKTLPRQKDVDLVQRLTCDDYRAPQTDGQIADSTRTPIEHVRDLRARVVAAYEGRPLPVPAAWRAIARARHARIKAVYAARLALRGRRAGRPLRTFTRKGGK